jgi:beta-galactosidase/beta-glucuronidase
VLLIPGQDYHFKENFLDIGYPRPQLERAQWMSLNGPWRFCYDDEQKIKQPSDIREWRLTIQVPYPPESKASGIGDPGFHRICWYERDFHITPQAGRTIMHFGAVDYHATVWVNGREVVSHEGGHTPFFADITANLDRSGLQKVTVRVEDDPLDLTKPRGKQDWRLEPSSTWYHRTTGIWQTVWIEQVSATYIGKIRWTPHLVGFALDFEARVWGDPAPDLIIEVELRHGDRVLAKDAYQVIESEVNRRIILSDPGVDDFRNEILWSPEQPTLLRA